MNYPLRFSFKILAFAPQVSVTDANGQEVCYVRQKLFKFKEHVDVYRTKTREQVLATIKADRVIDWSARYTFHDANGREVGAVGRRGAKSLWRAHYDIYSSSGEPNYKIEEANPMAKVADSLVGSLPIVGILSTMLFHPSYVVQRTDGSEVMRLTKKAAFFEGVFILEKLDDTITQTQELDLLLSFLMLILLERRRG